MKMWIHITLGLAILLLIGNLVNNAISRVWHPVTIIHPGVEGK